MDRKKGATNEEKSINYSFWAYILGFVIVIIFALLKVNERWAFILSFLIGIMISIINIFTLREIRWTIVKYLGIVLSLNAISIVLSLANLSLAFFSLFYMYTLSLTATAVIILSIFSLIEEK